MKYEELTGKIIRAFYNVYNTLGYGFLEKVYERAMLMELIDMGLKVENQKKVSVFYKQRLVGDYFSDLVIEDLVICELKAQEVLCQADECQLVNYLKATEIEVGIVFNFGKKPEFRRKLFENAKKPYQ
jgi:GxxExxY protein